MELTISQEPPTSQKINCVQVRGEMRPKTHRKYCVICEKECVGNNCPCVIPRDILLIDKDAHELDDSKCWMCLKLPLAVEIVTGGRSPTSFS